jgi:PKD repeat protein
MRSIPLMTATSVILTAALACGDGGTDVGNPPVANFTAPSCTAGAACSFNDSSTPVGGISTWSWNFGDANAPTPADNISNLQNPTHSYSQPGTYNVQLTVTNASSQTHSITKPVTVAAPANLPPTASFSVPSCGIGVECQFDASPSTDTDGQVVAAHWEFGDPTSPNNTADGLVATHIYGAAGTYNVTLTVTDNGGATGTTTQSVTVLPAAAEDCENTNSTLVTCTLDITARSTVKLTLTSRDCELSGNRVSVDLPRRQTAFVNICTRPFPAEYTIIDVNGNVATFQPGAQLPVLFTQGTADPEDPVPGTPVARVEGAYPRWTITIDDGGDPDGQNEPDFNDVILIVDATAAP